MVRRVPLSVIACWALMAACLPAPATAEDAPPVADNVDGDGGTSAFYQIVGTSPDSEAGRMIRTETMASDKLPTSVGQGFRILYVSTDGLDGGRRVPVSGEVLMPKSSPPAGGWPVVAWAHGTTGVADVCAPSWRGYSTRDRTYLNRWLEEGFAVVASDYQGLGTPGPHPYLLYRPEGYSMLDALRASLAWFAGTLDNRIILVGQSQGSGAALGSAWLAPGYAPNLHVLGVVATGLVVDFVAKPGSPHPPLPVSYDDPAEMDAAYAMLRVEGTDHSLHPGIPTRTTMTPEGVALSHVARTACLIDLFKKARSDGVSGHDLFTVELADIEAGEAAATHIPDARITFPVLAGTGLADYEASLPGQYNAVAAMCDGGTTVAWHLYPGLTHNGAVNGSLVDSVPFAKALLKGMPIASTCSSIPIPGPVQPAAPGIPFNN